MPGSATSTPARPPFGHLLVANWTLDPAHRARLAPLFAQVTHVPQGRMPTPAQFADADIIYGLPRGEWLTGVAAVPRLRFIQLGSAGSELVVRSPLWQDPASERIQVASAAGVHTGPIPQYFIATTLMLFHRLQEQILIGQVEKRWGNNGDMGGELFVRELRGKTVGVLGYGHIGREAARLAAAFGARILAATSRGERAPQEGYIIPGTGDPDGALPVAWHSTRDARSLHAFLAESDVLLLALPSTPATKHMLNADTLAHVRSHAVVVNVGRGDAIDTDALVAALDEGRLAGAALDVAEGEPLPEGHPIFGRKNVIVTPHMSGRTERYHDLAIDIFTENLERLRKDEPLLNVVDPRRGY
ncbi:oxidoreductase family protein [Phanerochaete sordida]|uniref:Oxidoreductase family protein n=1 Tax=Phanerochaete sordida TaxID=48140 RepID=A0A9P3GFW1_9APHY|nr:oxidoreductase family protein [Phanerochaete sordida]